MRVVPVEELVAGVATGDGGRWRPFGGGRWRPFGDSGRCGDTNRGKLLEGLPSSSVIGNSILILCFLIKLVLEFVMGAVAVLAFVFFWGDGGGETGTATRFRLCRRPIS